MFDSNLVKPFDFRVERASVMHCGSSAGRDDKFFDTTSDHWIGKSPDFSVEDFRSVHTIGVLIWLVWGFARVVIMEYVRLLRRRSRVDTLMIRMNDRRKGCRRTCFV